MQKIFDQLKSIWYFFNNFFENLINFFKDIFLSIWLVIQDSFYWIIEQVLNLATSAITSVDFSGINQHTGAFGSIPSDMLNVMGLCGVGTCLSIIGTALLIRLVLQLIPFVRLGS
jgi:hypothetical protein